MPRPRLLDLFCGAGGAAVGYHRAGSDQQRVTRRPFRVHCRKSRIALTRRRCVNRIETGRTEHHRVRLVELKRIVRLRFDIDTDDVKPVRDILASSGVPYVIENVEGAPLFDPVVLCGSMFGLCVERGWLKRHRLFECSFHVNRPLCDHPEGVRAVGVYGHGGHSGKHRMLYAAEARDIMEIDWMNRDELTQAIPPAYTEYVGVHLMEVVTRERQPALS